MPRTPTIEGLVERAARLEKRRSATFTAGIMAQGGTMCLARMIAIAAIVLSCATPVSPARADTRADIKALVDRYVAAVKAKDVDAIMKVYVPDKTLLVFDVFLPRQYAGAAVYRKDWQDFVDSFNGPIGIEVTDLEIGADQTLAFSHDIERWTGTDKQGKKVDITVRVTDVYKKIKGRWLIVHEHNSFPVDANNGNADLNSTP
jgi:uncharacterized protein (TIGR02246 family)